MQTPQAFRAPELLAAYRAAADDGFEGTDTAACVAAYADLAVAAVPEQPAQPQGHLPRGRGPRGGAQRARGREGVEQPYVLDRGHPSPLGRGLAVSTR